MFSALFQDNAAVYMRASFVSVKKSKTAWLLKMGQIARLETSASIYQSHVTSQIAKSSSPIHCRVNPQIIATYNKLESSELQGGSNMTGTDFFFL